MQLSDIEHLLARGELDTLECKKSTGQISAAMESLCALLNGKGGTVLIGVAPQGKIVGQQVSDGTQQEIHRALAKIDPAAPVDLELVDIPESDRQIIVLRAPAVHDAGPFTFTGRPYQRVGTVTSVMPQDQYRRLLLERVHEQNRWEKMPAVGLRVKDLDGEEIRRTVRSGVAVGRLPESTGNQASDILDRLRLRTDGQILNAAVVLFGKEFLPDYPQCQVRMARFKGVNKRQFMDNRQVRGNGFQLLDEAMLFLQRHLPVAGRIEPGRLERIDEPLFPSTALREALVNAICHRDYSITGGAISLAIYDDRLEIWSDGILPFGLKVDDLKRNHQSRPRNPLIADTFFRRGLGRVFKCYSQIMMEAMVTIAR